MNRPLVLIISVALIGTVWGGTSTGVTFFQEPSTAKESNVQGSRSSGVVGAPGRSQQSQREEELRELFQQKVLQQQKQAETARDQDNRDQSPQSQPDSGSSSGVVAPSGPSTSPRRDRISATSSGGIKLNLKDADIDRLVNMVMQELGYSYVIDPQVQGTVSIFSMREIPRERLFEVLEQLLKMNGVAIVKQEDYFVIVPIGESPTIPHGVLMSSPGTQAPSPETQAPSAESETEQSSQESTPEASVPSAVEDPSAAQEEPQNQAQSEPQIIRVGSSQEIDEQGVVTYIIPLHYILSDQMLEMVKVFLSPGSTVVDFAPANMLIITDFPQNIQQALTLVELLDTRYFDLHTIDLIQIRFNQAVDVAEDLAKIFAPGDSAAGVRIVAIERLNSVLVVTRSVEVFEEVKRWIEKLDAPSSTSNLKTFVYQVENNTAVQIAQILAELYADGEGLPSSLTGDSREDQQGRLARDTSTLGQRTPTRDPSFVQSDSRFGRDQFGSRESLAGGGGFGGPAGMRQLGPALSSASQSQIRGIYAGNVKLVVNEFNNSLIIQGTEADIQFMLDTIRQLDTLPRQVVIEAEIYSVELRDDLSFGVSAFLQAQGIGATGEGGAFTPATTGSISDGLITVTTRAMVGAEREMQAIVTALSEKTNVEIVEAPRILALDGTPASINVGAEVPVTSASFGNPLQSGTTNFVNSIQFRPTGTTLLIVPRISASGNVTMDLVLEVSSATGPALTPTINRNYIQSSFIVRDGQTIGIAGLISDAFNLGRSRVPVLGDIPILGALFGTTTKNDRRFELIIFITPKVIRNLPTSAELSLEFKRALRHAYDFIRSKEIERAELLERRRKEELEAESQSQSSTPEQ